MLELLEQATEDCKRSGAAAPAEICRIRLCDPSLDGSNAGLAARIAAGSGGAGHSLSGLLPRRNRLPPAADAAPPGVKPFGTTPCPPPPDDSDAPPMEGARTFRPGGVRVPPQV